MTIQSIPINVSASGANTIVAAVGNSSIKILSVYVSSNAAVNVNFQSHTTTTQKTGTLYLIANNNSAVWNYNPLGWFKTAVGEALDINLGGAVAVGGQLVYETVVFNNNSQAFS